MINSTRVQFWGTRGSIPRPGRDTLRYGGNTSCVQVTSPKGTLVIIDCGTGAHDLGQSLVANSAGPLRGSILISHTHWDHIQGFPFFAPLFVRGSQWDIYGPAGLGQSLRETLAGQMQYSYFPVTLDELGASIRFHDLAEGSFEIDDVRIRTLYLNHPALTLGYRLETANACMVYACDHEPFSRLPGVSAPIHENDRLHSEFLTGADLVIHDAQFTDAEYAAKKGWGHSPVESWLRWASRPTSSNWPLRIMIRGARTMTLIVSLKPCVPNCGKQMPQCRCLVLLMVRSWNCIGRAQVCVDWEADHPNRQRCLPSRIHW